MLAVAPMSMANTKGEAHARQSSGWPVQLGIRHAALRMVERGILQALLLQVIDEGATRYSDPAHLWAWMDGRTIWCAPYQPLSSR